MKANYSKDTISTQARLIGIEELSERIGLRPHTIYQWISQRRMPFPYVKIGRSVKFEICDVNTWIEAQKIAPSEN